MGMGTASHLQPIASIAMGTPLQPWGCHIESSGGCCDEARGGDDYNHRGCSRRSDRDADDGDDDSDHDDDERRIR